VVDIADVAEVTGSSRFACACVYNVAIIYYWDSRKRILVKLSGWMSAWKQKNWPSSETVLILIMTRILDIRLIRIKVLGVASPLSKACALSSALLVTRCDSADV